MCLQLLAEAEELAPEHPVTVDLKARINVFQAALVKEKTKEGDAEIRAAVDGLLNASEGLDKALKEENWPSLVQYLVTDEDVWANLPKAQGVLEEAQRKSTHDLEKCSPGMVKVLKDSNVKAKYYLTIMSAAQNIEAGNKSKTSFVQKLRHHALNFIDLPKFVREMFDQV